MAVPTAPVLVQRLKAIREPSVRRKRFAELLAEGDPGRWVEVITDLLARAGRTDDADAQAIVECLAHAVGDPLAYDARVRLYAAAREAGRDAVARLLVDASPATATERELAQALEPERRIVPRERALTLGERKALARSSRRDFLVPLLRDPHPDVVAILLDNPHVTERDVVTVAALRPAAPAALARVADHPRWSSRYAVKRAVVLNPYTPAHVAVRLATTLRRADLLELARDVHIPSALRAYAAELLSTARS